MEKNCPDCGESFVPGKGVARWRCPDCLRAYYRNYMQSRRETAVARRVDMIGVAPGLHPALVESLAPFVGRFLRWEDFKLSLKGGCFERGLVVQIGDTRMMTQDGMLVPYQGEVIERVEW